MLQWLTLSVFLTFHDVPFQIGQSNKSCHSFNRVPNDEIRRYKRDSTPMRF